MPAIADDINVEADVAPTPLPLRTNFAWTLGGNVIYAGCQWGMLVALAKLGTPEKVGQFALGLAVTAPIMMFSQMQLRAVQATDAKREYQFGDYLALRLLTTALALLLIGGIVAISGYHRETALVVLIVGAMKAIDSLSDVYYGLWQQHECMDGIARAMMVNGAVSLAALAALMAATHSIVLATLGSMAGSTCAWLYTLACNRRLHLAAGRTARPRWNGATMKRLAWLALPLGVATMLMSLNTNVPRYFLESQRGTTELGIYAAIGYLMVGGTTIVGALGQSVMPRMSKHFRNADVAAVSALLFRMLLVALALGVTGIAAAIFFGHRILTVLYGPEYASYSSAFTWAMLAAAVLYVAGFLSFSLTSARGFRLQFAVYAVTLCCILSFSMLFVRHRGVLGACQATTAAAVMQTIAAAVAIRHCLYHHVHTHE